MLVGAKLRQLLFETHLALDIRNGRTKNPILANYWLACGIWDKLGINVFEFEALPWQMGEDICTMLALENKNAEYEHRKAAQKARHR